MSSKTNSQSVTKKELKKELQKLATKKDLKKEINKLDLKTEKRHSQLMGHLDGLAKLMNDFLNKENGSLTRWSTSA